MDDAVLIDRLAEAIARMRVGGRAIGDIDRRRCRGEVRRAFAILRSEMRF